MKIVELNILDKGNKTVNTFEIQDGINGEALLKKIITACSLYVKETNILDVSRDELIENFLNICSDISEIRIIEFDSARDRGGFFNYYEGQFIISDFNKFKQFVCDNDNFKLEKILNELFYESTLKIMEVKIIINALKTNSFDLIDIFIKKDIVLDHLHYLTNIAYIRLDYSYGHVVVLQRDHDIKIHDYV